MKELEYGNLSVSIAESREALGEAAAEQFAIAASAALADREDAAVILATGNSQLDFVHALRKRADIAWPHISVFHMDEYLGMREDHPASFRRWMQERLVMQFNPKAFYGMRGDHVPVEDEIARYTTLLHELTPTICVMGIGENGHLAFNDPPADFETRDLVHVVDLDEKCRQQQVGEGHFASAADVPRQALSMTVHALLQPETVLVLAPEARKAQAVKAALEGAVTPSCPASILQTRSNARLYLDADSSALLNGVS